MLIIDLRCILTSISYSKFTLPYPNIFIDKCPMPPYDKNHKKKVMRKRSTHRLPAERGIPRLKGSLGRAMRKVAFEPEHPESSSSLVKCSRPVPVNGPPVWRSAQTGTKTGRLPVNKGGTADIRPLHPIGCEGRFLRE